MSTKKKEKNTSTVAKTADKKDNTTVNKKTGVKQAVSGAAEKEYFKAESVEKSLSASSWVKENIPGIKNNTAEGKAEQDEAVKKAAEKVNAYKAMGAQKSEKKSVDSWLEKYGISTPNGFLQKNEAVINPYASPSSIKQNEAAAMEADFLTGKSETLDTQKAKSLREEADKESSAYVTAYRKADSAKEKEKIAAQFKKDKRSELYLGGIAEDENYVNRKARYIMPKTSENSDYTDEIYLNNGKTLTTADKFRLYSLAEQYAKKNEGAEDEDKAIKQFNKALSNLGDDLTSEADKGFVTALQTKLSNGGFITSSDEKGDSDYEKYVAPVIKNGRNYYFPKDAEREDYIEAASRIAGRIWNGEKVSEEEKAQLYSIVRQYMTKVENDFSWKLTEGSGFSKKTRSDVYEEMASIFDGTVYLSIQSVSPSDKAFMKYLKNELKGKAATKNKAEATLEEVEAEGKSNTEYKKYIEPIIKNGRSFYFPKGAEKEDYTEAASRIVKRMWRGEEVSEEEKAQLYSIVGQYIKTTEGEKDTGNKIQQLNGMKKVLGAEGNDSVSLLSEEDTYFLNWLSSKLDNEGKLARTDDKLKKTEEKYILGYNTEYLDENTSVKVPVYKDKGFITSNWGTGSIGITANRLGNIYAETGDKRFYEVAKKFQSISEGVAAENLEDINPDNMLLDIAANGIQNLPLQLDQLKEGARLLPLAAVAVMCGAPIGEVLKATYIAGSSKSGFEIMRGEAIVNLTDMGLSYKDALKLANNEGFINALIESGDSCLDIIGIGAGETLAKNAVDVFSGAVKSGVAKTAAKGLLKLGLSENGVKTVLKYASAAGAFTVDVLGEGAEEWLQSSVSMANKDAANDILTGKSNSSKEGIGKLIARSVTREYTDEENEERKESFKGGVKGGIFFSVGHLTSGAVKQGLYSAAADMGLSRTEGKSIIENGLVTQVLEDSEGVTDETGKSDARVKKARDKIVKAIEEGKKVGAEDWGRLSLLTAAANEKNAKENFKRSFYVAGRNSKLSFDDVKESIGQDVTDFIGEDEAFLAYAKGKNEKNAAEKLSKKMEGDNVKDNASYKSEDVKRRLTREELLKRAGEKNREETEYYYLLGKIGDGIEKIYSDPFFGGVLSKEEAARAWSLGKYDRAISLKNAKSVSGLAINDRVTGLRASELPETTARAINALYRRLGVKLYIKDAVRNEAGQRVGGTADFSERTAYISHAAKHKKLKGAALTRYFAVHEAVHVIKNESADAFNTLYKSVPSELLKEGAIKEKIVEYEKSGINLSNEAAREEIVAEYIGEALANADRKTLHKIIGDRRNVAEVLLDVIDKLIAVFKGDKELIEGYKKARQAVIDALSKLENKNETAEKEESSGTRYAVNEEYGFSKQIDDAIAGKMKRGYSVYVGRTPKLLIKSGLEQRALLINQAHLRDIVHEKTEDNIHYHGIEVNIIKQLPELLKRPVAIYDSISEMNKENTICVLTDSVDNDGNPIIVSIRGSNQNVKYYDVSFNTVKGKASNYTTSIYGKDNFLNHLEEVIKKGALIYANKSNTQKLLEKIIPRANSDIKLQLLERLDSLGFDNIIHQSNNVVNRKFMQKEEKYAVSDEGRITAEDVKAVQSIGRKSVNDFSSAEIEKTKKFAQRYFKEMGVKSPFFRAWFGDWRAHDKAKVNVVTKKGRERGKVKNNDTGWEVQVSGKVFNETKSHNQEYNVRAKTYLEYINSIVENAVLLDSYSIPSEKRKSAASALMHNFYALADIGNGTELLKLYVEELNDVNSDGTIKRAYQLQNIENRKLNDRVQGNPLAPSASASGGYTISDLFNLVKQKDKNFHPKDVNSVLLNEDGTPRKFYHGTDKGFYEFKHSELRSREGSFFFTPSKEEALSYSGTGTVIPVYLSAEKLIDYNDMPSDIYKLADKKAQVEALRALGYDGWYADMEDGYGEVSVFNSNQIKSANENVGTFDKGNNDIRYAVSDENNGTEDEEKKKYLPKGEAPYRDIDILAETEDGKTSRFVRTVAESEFTTEEVAKNLQKAVEEGAAAYDVYSDKKAVEDANRWFESMGQNLEKAAKSVEDLIKVGGLVSKEAFAIAQLTYNKLIDAAVEAGDTPRATELLKRAEDMIIDVSLAGTKAGQTVQAMRLIKRLSPEGRLNQLKKAVDELNDNKKPDKKEAKKKTRHQELKERKRILAGESTEKQKLAIIEILKKRDTAKAREALKKIFEAQRQADEGAGLPLRAAEDKIDSKKDAKVVPTGASSKMGLMNLNINDDISQNDEFVKHAVSDENKKSEISQYEMMSDEELISLYIELLRADEAREDELSEIDKELSELSKPSEREQRNKQKIEAVKRGKRRAEEGVSRAREKLKVANKERIRLESEILDLKASEEALTKEAQAAKAEKNAVKKAEARLSKRVDKLKELAEARTKLEAELSEKRASEEALKKEIAASRALKNADKRAIKSVEERINQKAEKLKGLSEELKKIEAELSEKRAEEEALNKETEATRAEIRALKKEENKIKHKTEKLKDLTEKAKQAQKKFESAQKELDVAKAAREAIDEYARMVEEENAGEKLYIPEDVKEAILKSRDAEELDAAMEIAAKTLAEQMPARFMGRRWREAWRYLAMLLNPTTHKRNILSNTAMYLTVGMKDIVSGVVSDVYFGAKEKKSKYGISEYRENSFVRQFGYNDRGETRQWIKNVVWENEKDSAVMGGMGKGKDYYLSEIMQYVKPFKTGVMNKINDFNSDLLELEDVIFLRTNFTRAFLHYMVANNLSMMDMVRNKVLYDEAVRVAAREAREATFRDVSKLANTIKKLNKKHPVVGEIMFGGNLPFTRTPFNIAKRGVEYSPLGIGKSLIKKAKDSFKHEYTYADTDFINDISKGITGSAIYASGMLMYALGMVFIGKVDSDDEDKYRKERGEQNFSVKIGDYTYTIDWMQPSCIPFLSGAALMKLLTEQAENDESMSISDALSVVTSVLEQTFEPLTQTSILSSFSDALSTVRNADNDSETIVNFFRQTLYNYAGQYVPSVLAKIARTIDPYERRYIYVKSDSPFPETEYFLRKTASKVPGFSKINPPYVDMFGQEAKKKEGFGDYAKSFLDNMLSPGYIKKLETDETDEELIRLSKTAAAGNKKVLNPWVKKTVKIDRGSYDETINLTADEYLKIKEIQGQRGTQAIRALIQSDAYKNMSDEARAEATDIIWDTVYQSAAAEVIPDFYMKKTARIADSLAKDPESLSSYAAAMAVSETAEDAEKVSYTPEQKKKIDEGTEAYYSKLSEEAESSGAFAGYGTEERTKAAETLYSYAKAKARSENEEGYELQGENKKLYYLDENTKLSPVDYISFEKYKKAADADGNGSYTQKEISEALLMFAKENGVSDEDLAYIWQLETDGLTKNNPYGAYLDPKYKKSSGKENKTWAN